MWKLGLIGGIGSGKSTVADLFCRLGAAKIDADVLGHEALFAASVKSAALDRWGPEVFNPDGELDRRRVARIVFDVSGQGNGELEFLTSLVHPLIDVEVEKRLLALKQEGRTIVLLDAPLLLEAHWDRFVDRILFVETPRPVRLARVMQRGWTEAEFEAREAAQIPVDTKRRRADWIVENEGNLERTLDQVQKIWQNIFEVF